MYSNSSMKLSETIFFYESIQIKVKTNTLVNISTTLLIDDGRWPSFKISSGYIACSYDYFMGNNYKARVLLFLQNKKEICQLCESDCKF